MLDRIQLRGAATSEFFLPLACSSFGRCPLCGTALLGNRALFFREASLFHYWQFSAFSSSSGTSGPPTGGPLVLTAISILPPQATQKHMKAESLASIQFWLTRTP